MNPVCYYVGSSCVEIILIKSFHVWGDLCPTFVFITNSEKPHNFTNAMNSGDILHLNPLYTDITRCHLESLYAAVGHSNKHYCYPSLDLFG